MFGFGGGFNGPGGGSTNSGSTSSGSTSSGSDKDKDRSVGSGGGMSPSERNGQGKEGTNSGPGNPGHSPSTSSGGGHEFGAGFNGPGGGSTNSGSSPSGGHETASKGDRVGGGSTAKGDRVGGSGSVGNDSKEGDRSLSMGMDPSRFGTRNGIGATIGDGPTYRSTETASMSAMDRMRSTDMAEARRADENRSVGMYNAAAALSEANAQRADAASTARVAENTSMNPFHEALNNFLGITRKAEAGLLDPYNRVVAGKKGTPDYADITNMTVDEAAEYASKLTGKPSHVLGGYQFKDTTLTSIADEMGIPRDAKMSPDVQSQLAVGLAQRRANKATVNGVVDKDKFAREMAKEWASFATAATGASFYSKNGIDKAGVSYGDVKAMTDGLVDTGVVGPRRSLGTMGDDPSLTASATGTTDTSTRFASTYMGTDKQKQKDYFGSVPDNQWPGNLEVAARNAGPAESGDTATAAAEDAAPQPASYTPDPSLTEFPERPRSMGEKVAAAGIDIGAGMIPGIGMGLGLINGGLALTGNRTLGEHIVDAIATGEGGTYTPGDGDPNRPEAKPEESTVVASADPETTVPKSFEERYMAFVDNTKRPTPTERWGTNAPYTV